MLDYKMEKEKSSRIMKIICTVIVCAAVIITFIAVFFHSIISDSSIYRDGTTRVPMDMDLYVDGELAEVNAQLPKSVTVENGSTLTLKGIVPAGSITRGDLFMVSSDAGIVNVYVNEKPVFSSTAGTSNLLYDLHLNTHAIYIGQFPENESVRTISIEFIPSGLAFANTFTIDRLTVGSFFDLVSSLRRSVTILAIQILVYITLLLMTCGVFASFIKLKNVRDFSLGLMLMLLQSLLITVSSSQMRTFILPNEKLWQLLLVFSYMIYPLCFMITFNKILRIRFLSGTVYWVLAFLPASLCTLSAVISLSDSLAAFDIFAKIKHACITVNMIYTVLCVYEMKRRDESIAASYAAGYSFLMTAAFIMDLVRTSEMYSVNAIDNAANMVRLTAIGCYIVFSISSYYTKMQGIMGQIELDEMLYMDSLSGCYNRRNFEAFRKKAGMIKEHLLIFVFDINDVKIINDCFGHSEGDSIISYFGSFINEYLPEGSSIYRMGGDEFVALLPASLVRENIDAYTQELKKAYSRNAPYSTSIAAGYSIFDGGQQADLTQALRKADSMMYEDKAAHKQKYRTLTDEDLVESENEEK